HEYCAVTTLYNLVFGVNVSLILSSVMTPQVLEMPQTIYDAQLHFFCIFPSAFCNAVPDNWLGNCKPKVSNENNVPSQVPTIKPKVSSLDLLKTILDDGLADSYCIKESTSILKDGATGSSAEHIRKATGIVTGVVFLINPRIVRAGRIQFPSANGPAFPKSQSTNPNLSYFFSQEMSSQSCIGQIDFNVLASSGLKYDQIVDTSLALTHSWLIVVYNLRN
ncbi:unnamed protein product, partial [Sphenostylis stenocarpa]